MSICCSRLYSDNKMPTLIYLKSLNSIKSKTLKKLKQNKNIKLQHILSELFSRCWFWLPLYLSDLLLGQLQFVWLVGPQQFGLSLPLLLQHSLSILPTLPRLHPVIKRPLQPTNTQRIISCLYLAIYFSHVAGSWGSYSEQLSNYMSTL